MIICALKFKYFCFLESQFLIFWRKKVSNCLTVKIICPLALSEALCFGTEFSFPALLDAISPSNEMSPEKKVTLMVSISNSGVFQTEYNNHI